MFNILLVCTGNATRSILAEAILNRDGAGRVRAWSAGTNPTGRLNAGTRRLLERRGLFSANLRSKSWDEFAAPGAPLMDVVVTLCASAQGEVAPTWPGAPLITHWDIDDPANAPGDQLDLAFQVAYHRLSARINALLAQPVETMTHEQLKPVLAAIAET